MERKIKCSHQGAVCNSQEETMTHPCFKMKVMNILTDMNKEKKRSKKKERS